MLGFASLVLDLEGIGAEILPTSFSLEMGQVAPFGDGLWTAHVTKVLPTYHCTFTAIERFCCAPAYAAACLVLSADMCNPK